MRTVKVAIGMVSYKGPHRDCYTRHYEFLHYLGRLQERSHWLQYSDYLPEGLPPLEGLTRDDPAFQFYTITHTGNSLVGQARDLVCETALEADCDYVLFFDDDMVFDNSLFLRLWRHNLPFVGALAFTAREPIRPVLYKFVREYDFKNKAEKVDIQVIDDYPENQLFRVDAIGTGVVLIRTDVLKLIPRPWFYGTVSCGEDIHFSWQCKTYKIPVYCDTSVKTCHVANRAAWHDEAYYLRSRGGNQ